MSALQLWDIEPGTIPAPEVGSGFIFFNAAGVLCRKDHTGAVVPVGGGGGVGTVGPAGPAGAVGPVGPAGPQGPAGDGAGSVGPAGPAGADGAPGVAGPAGADGAQGPQGVQGLQGVPGAVGPAGPAGGGVVYVPDHLFSSVDLLLDFQGVEGSAVVVDRSSKGRTITAAAGFKLSSVGAAVTDSVGSFGGSFLTVDQAGEFSTGAGDFCVESKVWLNDLAGNKVIFAMDLDAHLAGWIVGDVPQFFASSNGGSWNLLSGDTGTLNGRGLPSVVAKKWTDICYQRTGDRWRVFVDGVPVLDTIMAGVVFGGARKLRIGVWGNGQLPATYRMQTFRFSKVSRYSGRYVPVPGLFPLAT